MENVSRDEFVVFEHLLEERLESALSEIPLKGAEADALPVEIAGDAAEALRRHIAGFKGRSEREAAQGERLIQQIGWGRFFSAGEKFRPRGGSYATIGVKAVVALKDFERTLRATTETSIRRAEVKT